MWPSPVESHVNRWGVRVSKCKKRKVKISIRSVVFPLHSLSLFVRRSRSHMDIWYFLATSSHVRYSCENKWTSCQDSKYGLIPIVLKTFLILIARKLYGHYRMLARTDTFNCWNRHNIWLHSSMLLSSLICFECILILKTENSGSNMKFLQTVTVSNSQYLRFFPCDVYGVRDY